jgi:hypothetical protein
MHGKAKHSFGCATGTPCVHGALHRVSVQFPLQKLFSRKMKNWNRTEAPQKIIQLMQIRARTPGTHLYSRNLYIPLFSSVFSTGPM